MSALQSGQGDAELNLRLVEVLAVFERAYARWVEAPLHNSHLTYARVRLLGVLNRKGPQTMSALSDELLVSPRNVTTLVDALEANGLARRRAHPTDRRATIVELTPQGMETCGDLHAKHAAAVSELFTSLAEAEKRELMRFLNSLVAELERKGIVSVPSRREFLDGAIGPEQGGHLRSSPQEIKEANI